MNLEGACDHIQGVEKVVHAKKRQCDECVTMGGQWVHLRTCQTCGELGASRGLLRGAR